jgi:4-hydroxy-tetrahydrodipicolinate reductase
VSSGPVRVVVAGVAGRMGTRILNALRADEGFLVVGATDRPESPRVGLDAGLLTSAGPLEVAVAGSLQAAFDKAAEPAQVVIDFTTPAASVQHAQLCAERGVALVVGTTGFSAQAKAELAGCSQRAPILMAPNMSVGVNLLFRLVGEAARALGPAYEVEIVELHHRNKADAPSGTALRLAEVAADALGLDAQSAGVYARHGQVGARKPGTIGVQTLRGGDVVGEHTVYFLADGERLELSHRASSRDNFARGAVRAARFLVGKPAGLYDMQDALGLRGGSQ